MVYSHLTRQSAVKPKMDVISNIFNEFSESNLKRSASTSTNELALKSDTWKESIQGLNSPGLQHRRRASADSIDSVNSLNMEVKKRALILKKINKLSNVLGEQINPSDLSSEEVYGEAYTSRTRL